MCTAATFKGNGFYFGRTLDYHSSYGEEVVITPRRKTLSLRNGNNIYAGHAIIGMAHVAEGMPLYYDAVNECGLCMAGLNFVGNAVFFPPKPGKVNIATFEFIPYILSTCATVLQARDRLRDINITDEAFSAALPPAQLHWIIADRTHAITVESTESGLNVYDNCVGVLTNNPKFPEQVFSLNNYMALSPYPPKNNFCASVPLDCYSNGMGALGLPGDLSSSSRFVRCAFTRLNAKPGKTETEDLSQFFHILDTVNQTRGCCIMTDGGEEFTIYTSCAIAEKGVYCYTTYNNRQITAVNMHKVNLDGSALVRYPLVTGEQIKYQN